MASQGLGKPVRVLLADDHALVREGIVKILASDPNIEVVGEASNGAEAIEKARELQPDAVLMDLAMPGTDGLAATRVLKQEMPQVRVIVLTVSNQEEDIMEAIRAGARGYIVKSVDANDLIRQMRQVLTGAVALSPEMTTKLVAGLAQGGRHSGHDAHGYAAAPLSDREKEVLALIVKGTSNKEIAANLFISEHTVRPTFAA